ncbi:hypothetical protein K7432_004203 [Basidiobolus ranarum]|uniref:Uncharacterized protein n=1 Tax=Basidiobolus ranarum TaxID=34480 RepID=A0ABR2WYI1_9FUNG
MYFTWTKCTLLISIINIIHGKCDNPRSLQTAVTIQAPEQIHSSITNWLTISVLDVTILNQSNLTLGLYSPDISYIKDLEDFIPTDSTSTTRMGVIVNISPQVANLPTYFILYEPVNCTMFGMSPVKILDVVGNSPPIPVPTSTV